MAIYVNTQGCQGNSPADLAFPRNVSEADMHTTGADPYRVQKQVQEGRTTPGGGGSPETLRL